MSNTTTQKTSFTSIIDSNEQKVARIEEYKKEKITNFPRIMVFGGLAFLGIMVAGMLALQIITGVLALGVAAVACVGGWFGIQWVKNLSPVMLQKMKNKQLELMYKEAHEKAIYQLDNQIIVNAERLSEARKARNKMGTAIEKLKGKVDHTKKGQPVYEQKMEIIERLETAYEQVIKNLDKGAKANIMFEEKVKEYKEKEAFAKMANEAMSLFEQNGSKQLEDMLSLESFNHIDSEFSTALISIENSTMDMAITGE